MAPSAYLFRVGVTLVATASLATGFMTGGVINRAKVYAPSQVTMKRRSRRGWVVELTRVFFF